MDDKITIIEGPPPTFEEVNEGWVLGLNESPTLGSVSVTRLRTFNGPALVERCHRAWRNQQPIHLEFRSVEGLDHHAPIVAARWIETTEGQVLLLWVRQVNEDAQLELGYEDDDADNGFDGDDSSGDNPIDDSDLDFPPGPTDWKL